MAGRAHLDPKDGAMINGPGKHSVKRRASEVTMAVAEAGATPPRHHHTFGRIRPILLQKSICIVDQKISGP